MSAAAASASWASASVASFSRCAVPRCGNVEASSVGPSGRGGGSTHFREVHASRYCPPRRVSPVTHAKRKSDWELMDEELRGMRASRGDTTALGVDYGLNRTGLAVSSGGLAPRPLGVVSSKPIQDLVQSVIDTALAERAYVIVVGLPVPPNLTLLQAAGVDRVPKPKPKSKNQSDDSKPPAFVDVAVLRGKQFRRIEDLSEWLGFEGLGRELTKHGMKAGGTADERAERLWRLIDANGDLQRVPSFMFPKSSKGKRLAMEAVWSPEGPHGKEFGGVPKEKEPEIDQGKGRRPTQMHVLCVRFAERIADAASTRVDHPLPVFLYDEYLTSAQAELAVEISTGGRRVPGAAAGLTGNANGQAKTHIDDVAAALLLERYFSGKHGPAIEVKANTGGT